MYVQLSRQKQLKLVERHRAGALQRELAEAYGIHRTTVAAIVKRHMTGQLGSAVVDNR